MQEIKSLASTYSFGIFNRNDAIGSAIMKIMKEGKRLKKSDLAQAFLTIEKNFKYPTKHQVLKEVENGTIQLYYAPPNVKLPTAMPFFLTKNAHGQIIALVSVDIYGSMDKDTGYVTIDPKKLYAMMESALFAIYYYTRHTEMMRKSAVIGDGSSIYAHMFARVLNKKYALNVDKTRYNNVIFLASKFFLVNILERPDDETTVNYAIRNCVNANPMILRELNDSIPEDAMTSITKFIQFLADPNGPIRLPDLTVRGYVEQYIVMYDASALLSLEYLPYFIYTILAVNTKSFINNQNILEDIVERSGPRLYVDLTRML